jgi:hypothetical protein
MSSARTPGASPSRGPLVTILAVIGILAIIAGILYVSGAANSLHFMDGASHKGHHQIRAIVSFVVGIAFLVGAYIAKSRPAGSRGSTSAGSASTVGSASTADGPGSASTVGGPGSASTVGSASTADGPDSASSPDSASGSATPSGT